MKKADYILKTSSTDPDLEFENLRNNGIDLIQKLSGSRWTDYNVHDPGVTILEQLCYAVTELGYKTNFDFGDLLASQNNDEEVDATFYSAANILHGKPITIVDFRKVLIDRINGLRDVWIEPLNLNSDRDKVKGTYIVLVKPSPAVIKTPEDKKKLLFDTRKCLEKYSNIGEAFDQIVILEEEEIFVKAEIELDSEANAELTHARVLFNVRRFISSPITFHSLAQMRDKGFVFEDIFSGPRLLNGFILDEDLKEKITTLITSDLINVIYNVEGVAKVHNLKIQKAGHLSEGGLTSFTYQLESSKTASGGHTTMDDTVLIDMNKVPVLAKAMQPYNPGYKSHITYYQNQTEVNIYLNKVIRYLRQIENENRMNYASIYSKKNDYMPKKGTFKPINEYFSIQNHFPAIYATGSRGIPPSYDQNRISQVKQLKTYLLFFEQILTNFLAQLTHISDLYSLNENLTQTYFAGSLESIPQINSLMLGLDKISDTNVIGHETQRISHLALDAIDNFHERRHQVLDHLLARFGERISNFGINNFNYNYTEEEHQKRLLQSKINILKEMVFLSSKRARSFNALKPFWEEEKFDAKTDKPPRRTNFSYLEKKVRYRLGIESPVRKLTNYLKIQIGDLELAKPFSTKSLLDYLQKKYLADDQLIIHSVTKLFKKDDLFKPKINIDIELLRRGVWLNNFKIITDKVDEKLNMVGFSKGSLFRGLSEKEKNEIIDKLRDTTEHFSQKPEYVRFWHNRSKNERILIEFRKGTSGLYDPIPSNSWVILKELDSKSSADIYISDLIHFLRETNINTEGFYLVDHIELRPRAEVNKYSIYLKHHASKLGFESSESFSFLGIQKAVIELVKQARQAVYLQKQSAENMYVTDVVYRSRTIGRLVNYENPQAFVNEDDLKEFQEFINSLTDFDLHDPSVVRYVLAKDTDNDKYTGLFYSFRISIIAPYWPSRFADPEFRKVFESTVQEEMPAHVGINFHHLNFNELEMFEHKYDLWLSDMKKNKEDNLEALNKSSATLAAYIKELEKMKSKNNK